MFFFDARGLISRVSAKKKLVLFKRVHQMQLAKSDDVERVSKMAPPISKRFISNFQVRRGCATFPSAARGRTATDDGAAARIHRGTLVGELAARTSLRGDVEVAHPATFPCYSTLPHRPRAT